MNYFIKNVFPPLCFFIGITFTTFCCKQKPEFHIQVRDCASMGSGIYAVEFTNDNWKSKESFKETSRSYYEYDLSFWDRDTAIAFASRFQTYEACKKYNDSIRAKAAAIRLRYKQKEDSIRESKRIIIR